MPSFSSSARRPFCLLCLAGAVVTTPLTGQVRTPTAPTTSPILLRAADGTSLTLSASPLEVAGEPCVPLADLAMALHGTRDLAPSLALSGPVLRAHATSPPPDQLLAVRRPGVISDRVGTGVDPGGRGRACVPAADIARAMRGVLEGNSIAQFDAQIESMMNNNLAFLALQTKVRNVAQITQMMSNIAKTDSDAKLNAIRNVRATLFDETESVLVLAPSNQVAWARETASQVKWFKSFVIHGKSDEAAEIQAAVRAAFPNDPPGMQAQTSLILHLVLMGDVIGALREYSILMDRDLRQFSRQIVDKLDEVREARSRVIQNFAREKPPRAYARQDPQSAARAQDRAQRYTQFVQMSTQLMGEIQHTERELVDALQTLQRDLDSLWQAYATMRDEQFRTDNRVMRIR